MRELDWKLRTDQSPVVDDGDQVAEVDQTISGDIKDAGFRAVGLVTRKTHAHPSSTRRIAAVCGGLDTNILDTTRAEFGAAIHFGTRCTTGPDAVVVLAAFKLGDVVDAVVGPIIWILEAASATRIHALIGDVHAGQTGVPRSTKGMEAFEFLHIVGTGQGPQIWIFIAACTGGRSSWTINPRTRLTAVPNTTKGFHALELVGFHASPTQVRILVAARAQDGLHVTRNVGTALAWVERRQGQRCTIRRGVIVVAPHDTKVFQEAASASDLLAVEIFTVHTVSGIDPAQSVTIRFAGLRLNLVASIINIINNILKLIKWYESRRNGKNDEEGWQKHSQQSR